MQALTYGEFMLWKDTETWNKINENKSRVIKTETWNTVCPVLSGHDHKHALHTLSPNIYEI